MQLRAGRVQIPFGDEARSGLPRAQEGRDAVPQAHAAVEVDPQREVLGDPQRRPPGGLVVHRYGRIARRLPRASRTRRRAARSLHALAGAVGPAAAEGRGQARARGVHRAAAQPGAARLRRARRARHAGGLSDVGRQHAAGGPRAALRVQRPSASWQVGARARRGHGPAVAEGDLPGGRRGAGGRRGRQGDRRRRRPAGGLRRPAHRAELDRGGRQARRPRGAHLDLGSGPVRDRLAEQRHQEERQGWRWYHGQFKGLDDVLARARGRQDGVLEL
mmetsp:Transcript_9658/g.28697  ORF Transcript_9658/g.28697 Transcript_9658/m.28697 type:complete len:275 (+) Transcript_9658:607-1431(+)